MGLALDTILAKVTNATALTAVTVAPGNALTVRGTDNTKVADLETVFFKGAAAHEVRIASPMLYNNTRALDFTTAEAPGSFLLPAGAAQPLQQQDTLVVQATSGSADSSAVAMGLYYSDLSGADAKLRQWSDISGMIEQYHTVEVDVTASGTIGAWNDTAINATQDDLKANRWHALLGYVVDVACLCVAFSGTDTSSLRASGPGQTRVIDTSDWFIKMSDRHGTPHIPVFNSANKGTTFVSVADNAASTAVKVQLITALLTSSFTA